MPALTPAQIADLQRHPHRLGSQFLYVFLPDDVFTGTVVGDVGRVQTIPHAGGTWANVLRGMTLWVGSTAGARDKGIVRVRADADAANLYVSEHEIDLSAGDHLTVKDEFRLWHVDTFITDAGVIYKDWDGGTSIAFPANVDDIYQPVPVMGPHSIEFINETTGLAGHDWDWRNSWTVSPNSGALSYAATFPGGLPAVSAATIGTVTWGTAGYRWVRLSLMDSMGANPDVTAYDARRLYITLDRDDLPDNVYLDFVPSPRMGTVDQGGFGMSFTVHIDAPEAAFPDGALVIWFFDGGTQMDIGGNWPGRSHIHFIGYIRKASTHKEPETGHVTFDATTLQGPMRALPMFPNFLEDDSTPMVWTEAASLTVQRAAYLHMRWNSSLLEMADVIFVPGATTSIGEHAFPEGFLYDQLNALVNRDYLYRIGCDPLSTVYFNKDPQFQATHPGVATIMDILAQDWRVEIDFPEPLEPQTAYVMASGNAYSAGALTPLFSEAPGPIPLEAGRKDKSLSRLICTTQIALNTLSGLALAEANNSFPDTPVKLDGQYYIGHLFPLEFVGLDIQSADTKRQMGLSGDLFIPRRSTLQVVYDSDGAVSNGLVDINVERVTTGEGVPGQTLTYPIAPPTPPGPGTGPPTFPWPPPPPPPPTPGVAGSVAASHDVGGVYWSDDRGGSWENRRTGAFLDLIWDPWWFTASRAGTGDPAHVILWGCGVGFVVRSGQDAGATWTDVTPMTDPPNAWGDAVAPTAAALTYKQVHGDVYHLDTFYLLAEWQEAGGDWRGWIAKTVDNGASWAWSPVSSFNYRDGYYYPSSWDQWLGWQFWAGTWALARTAGQWYGYVDLHNLCDTDEDTWAQIYRGWWVGGAGRIGGRLHYGIGFTRAAGIIPVELKFMVAGGALLATECRLGGDTPPSIDQQWLFLADPANWPECLPIDTIIRTVNILNSDIADYMEIQVSGFGRATCACVAYVRIHEDYADAVPASRPLAMDLDMEDGSRLYVTMWHDGELYLDNRDATTFVINARYDVGAATEAQVANKTRFIVPRCAYLSAAPDGDLVWLFGRWDDGTPRHIAYSSDGALTFASREDAAWDANHRVGAMEVFYDNQAVYALINHAATPRLWQSVNQGVAWSNINSVPFNVEFEAFTRCNWAADEFFIGRNGPGAQMAAWLESPYTGTWVDGTGSPSLPTAAGAISAVIWV